MASFLRPSKTDNPRMRRPDKRPLRMRRVVTSYHRIPTPPIINRCQMTMTGRHHVVLIYEI